MTTTPDLAGELAERYSLTIDACEVDDNPHHGFDARRLDALGSDVDPRRGPGPLP